MKTHRAIMFPVLTVVLLPLCIHAYSAEIQPASLPFTEILEFDQTNNSWHQVQAETLVHKTKSTVLVRNNAIGLHIEPGSSCIEVYAFNEDTSSLRALIHPVSTIPINKVVENVIVENTESNVVLDVFYDSNWENGIRIELEVGMPFIKTQAIGAINSIRIEAPSRFAVLPDFFADDIVLDAQRISVDKAEQPSENFFIHLLDKGNAMLMTVWDKNIQDVTVTISGESENRKIQSVDLVYAETGNIWLAVLEGAGIWHMRTIEQSDLGELLPLDWQAPFDAMWRIDWRQTNGLTDTWEMVAENADGSFLKEDLFESTDDAWDQQRWWSSHGPRFRWNTVLGRYLYPAWFDKDGAAFLQPIKEVYNWSAGDGAFYPLAEDKLWLGPAVIFPVDRNKKTPIDKFTVIDIVRATLGVGPCQYILDVEGQQAQFKGETTCRTRDNLNAIYENKQQIQRHDEVEQALDEVLIFIKLIRSRIEMYQEFNREMDAYLIRSKERQPELAAFVAKMKQYNDAVRKAFEERKEGIKTIAFAQGLVDEFRNSVVGYTGDDAVKKCKDITIQLVYMGDNQDELVSECRLAVKVLRQQAALAIQKEPRATEIVREIRNRTRQILRNPASYEAARH